jgi:hypothetical protein
MIEAEHTAGPWQFREQGDANEFAVLDSTGRWLFSIRHNGEELLAKQLANLRLAAAAPDLLTALHDCLDQMGLSEACVNCGSYRGVLTRCLAHAAIAKVTGVA